MSNKQNPLLVHTPSGIYCPAADVYLDPWRPVQRALITHAHSDHARPGSAQYLTHRVTVSLLHQRLGTTASQVHGLEYGETITIRGVTFSLHPAGHVLGSAQILVESRGARWVFSGDYKLEDDGITPVIEPVRCHTFISECTFGLPIFRWRPQQVIFDEIHSWWRANRSKGYASIISAYSLGKAQRVLANLDHSVGPIVVHPVIQRLNSILGVADIVTPDEDLGADACPLVLVPPAVLGASWCKQFGDYKTAAVSGWMAISGMKRRRGVDAGFLLSDHADFHGLNLVIEATGAEQILLTHGYTAQYGRYLAEQHPNLRVAELGAEFGADPEE